MDSALTRYLWRLLFAIRGTDCAPRVLLGLAFVVPSLLLAGVAWRERAAMLDEGRIMAEKTVAALAEHAAVVFDSIRVVLSDVDARVSDRGWDDIAADLALHEALVQTVARYEPIASIGLVDSAGRLRQGSVAGKPSAHAFGDRDYFQAHLRPGGSPLFISGPFEGPIGGDRQFAMSIPRTSADGTFDGMIVVAVRLDYFMDFWSRFAPSTAHVIPLVRSDGELLLRFPAPDNPERIDPNGPLLSRARAEPKGFYSAASAVDGVERLNAYARIKDYPLYIAFSIETRAILEQWQQRMLVYALFTVVFTLALVALTAVVGAQMRRHRHAASRWKRVAESLEAEIAHRKEVEAKLVQAQKMEIVGRLTGGVAHDFNNLLQAMLTNVHLARMNVGDHPAARFLEELQRGIDRAAKLTHQLMSFSRRRPLAPRAIDLAQFAEEIADLLQRTLGSGIEIQFQIPDGTWLALADRNQMEMALLNLVINARDAMPDGGEVTIHARNVTVEREGGDLRPGEYVMLAVTDTGHGMPSEVLNHIFEPFYTTKDVGKGSGLGLSMVHGFATQSGGTVAVDSEPDAGTTVSLYLPRAPDSAGVERERAALPPARARPTRGVRVLLVDDDRLVRVATASSLEQAGYAVLQAANGAEAIGMLRDERVDVLVTDYAMPGIKGTEVVRRARMIQPRIGTLLITGYATAADEDDLGSGLDVVHKPFLPDELISRIEHVIRQGLATHTVRSRNRSAAKPGPFRS